jgi:hypothetical protein
MPSVRPCSHSPRKPCFVLEVVIDAVDHVQAERRARPASLIASHGTTAKRSLHAPGPAIPSAGRWCPCTRQVEAASRGRHRTPAMSPALQDGRAASPSSPTACVWAGALTGLQHLRGADDVARPRHLRAPGSHPDAAAAAAEKVARAPKRVSSALTTDDELRAVRIRPPSPPGQTFSRAAWDFASGATESSRVQDHARRPAATAGLLQRAVVGARHIEDAAARSDRHGHLC